MEQKRNASVDEKNNFIYCSNTLVNRFKDYVEKIKDVTMGTVVLDNIGKVFYKRVMGLYEDVNKLGIDYFDEKDFSLSLVIDDYFMKQINEAMTQIEGLASQIGRLWIYAYVPNNGELIQLYITTTIDKYNNCVKRIANFDLNKDLETILAGKYSDSRYFIHTPGSYRKMFQDDMTTITKLGLESRIPDLTTKFSNIIEEQEKKTSNYAEIEYSEEDVMNVIEPDTTTKSI